MVSILVFCKRILGKYNKYMEIWEKIGSILLDNYISISVSNELLKPILVINCLQKKYGTENAIKFINGVCINNGFDPKDALPDNHLYKLMKK